MFYGLLYILGIEIRNEELNFLSHIIMHAYHVHVVYAFMIIILLTCKINNHLFLVRFPNDNMVWEAPRSNIRITQMIRSHGHPMGHSVFQSMVRELESIK